LNLALGYAKSGLMPTDETPTPPADNGDKSSEDAKRPLAPAAERALAEAAARRAEVDRAAQKAEAPKEVAGRGGLDPARYGDWEINGLISDF
jgi:hypothetical protein